MSIRFSEGDLVRILDLPKRGHVRIPRYVRNRIGTVERWCGAFPIPKSLPTLGQDCRLSIIWIRLNQTDLWADYKGSDTDTLDIEVYDHWLSAPEAKA